jgi:hypothetical protein
VELSNAVNVGYGSDGPGLVKRLADEERQRDVMRVREETAARKADLVRVRGQRLFE